jgi:hypothetical protein
MSDKGDREFHVWFGPFSGTVWAGMMRYDGERWESVGWKHDVTLDVAGLFASTRSREMLAPLVRELHPLAAQGPLSDDMDDA